MAEQIRGKEMAEQIRYTVSCFSWFIFSHLPNIVFQSGTKKKKKKVTKQLSSTGFHYETGQTLIDK